jgi:flavin reductase (DIM6/NTAB) family NADH-FMN oxidoreductase RutF
MDEHFYEVASGHGLPHDPFKSIVAPRPIGWISTIDRDGRANLAPYSFFNGFATYPPVVGFSSEGWKDSVANAEATGEFVCNLATRRHAEQMNKTSMPVPHEMSEFDLAGLTRAPCRLVKPPRVADAPAALECKVLQIIQLRDLDGRQLENYLTLGQVVAVHIDRACLTEDGLFDMARAGTIARCGYATDYVEVEKLFRMHRPRG